jgi:hypothetical protein
MPARITRLAQLWLAAALLLVATLFATDAAAQIFGVTNANMGTVGSAASGSTTFTFAASTGAVTRDSGLGGRSLTSPSTVRSTVQITCSVNYCKTGGMRIRITNLGSPTGRAGTLTNFTVALGPGTSTATIVSGPTTIATNTIEFTLSAIGQNKTVTVYVGATVAFSGDDSGIPVGAASSSFLLLTAATNGNNGSSTTGTMNATVQRALSMAKISDLSFGRIVRPLTGSGTVSLAAADATQTISAGVWLGSPFPARARYTVTGEGGQQLSVTVDPTFVMSNGTGGTITVTTNNNLLVSPVLNSSFGGAAGTYSFYVGGSFPIANTTPSGSYTGVFTVTAAYN